MITNDFSEDVENCLSVLETGGLILYPTDTVWGIGCDATNAEAVDKVINLKQRPDSKSFVVLVASEKEVLQHVAAPDLAVFDYLKHVAKPTTVIYENALGLAPNVTAADGSVAIRICGDAFCRHLIKRFGKPLLSTSANLSGMPSAAIFAQVDPAIKSGVDYIVQYRQYDVVPAQPSAIVMWKNGSLRILRP
ncbi:L-threonylcarbamoyladenylate synthase [Filimonas effusa]|uniref:L-threonylcarbamoyladenylate synthase n=1 Tax=Filimonas effusa TaxID=2508721 RepID=A0A4Q1D8L0_9BACT|nr:L-threonylcarbamoyladenylate synthase [Filimonas effusa]RXK85621.1 threonylcarbamoyl-AMP synthase [Filimonas effusa]